MSYPPPSHPPHPPPVPPLPPLQPLPRAPRSWWSRNWKWFVPVGIILPILVCGGGITGMVFFGLNLIKSSAPYQDALKHARANSAVVAALGQPIDSRLLPQGSVNINNDAGSVDLKIPIGGPRGSGVVHIVGTRSRGNWTYTTLDFTADNGGPGVDLLKQPAPATSP